MADNPVTVRISDEVKLGVEKIVDGINSITPRKVSTSDVLRAAIEEYVKYDEVSKTNIFVTLPHHRELTVKQATVLLEAMLHIQKEFDTESVNEAVRKYQDCLEMAEFYEWKKQKENKGGE